MLVRFQDTNDPKTVEPVDPYDLEKSFGKGVKLISAKLEMTDESVIKGIEKRLPWIRKYYGNQLDGDRSEILYNPPSFANKLSSGNFAAGLGLSPYE